MTRLFNELRTHRYFIKEEPDVMLKLKTFNFEAKEKNDVFLGTIYIPTQDGQKVQWGFVTKIDGLKNNIPHTIEETPQWFILLYEKAQEDYERMKKYKKIFNA